MAKKPRTMTKLTDAELLLYQSVVIIKMREEILNTLSLMGEMPKEVQDKIMENHYYNVDENRLLKEVIKRHFPDFWMYNDATKKMRSMKELKELAEDYFTRR